MNILPRFRPGRPAAPGLVRPVFLLNCAVLVALLAALSPPPVARADTPVSCLPISVPVTALVVPATVAGTLCTPGSTARTIMVLVPGATYRQVYWDFPYRSDVYSFRRAMNRAGYATLTVDRIGSGDSSHPPSATVTAVGQADAVHQIIGGLRAGRIGPRAFHKVIIGGHSLGSGIVVHEAAIHHDVDAVLLTGYSHEVDPVGVTGVVAGFTPAVTDPQFAGRGYDPGYLTTRPGTRRDDFYAPGDFEPQVVDTDEKTKDLVTPTEFADGLFGSLPPESTVIGVPTLIVNGSRDKLACGSVTGNCASAATLQSSEAPFFAAGRLSTELLAGSGHDVNLATNTRDYQAAVIRWADQNVGTAEDR